jgi:hypothetical protein
MSSITKVTALIPEVKRLRLGKAVVKGDIVVAVARTGKKVSVPKKEVLYKDEKTLVYRFTKRKIVKGTFEIRNGFVVDPDTGTMVSASCLAIGEAKTPSKKKKVKKSGKKAGKKVKDKKKKKGKKKSRR